MNQVICIDNSDYKASLELNKAYQVVPNETLPEGFISIIDESGEEYIYSEKYFAPIDSKALAG